jgi:cytochrome c oxidase subunit 4
MAAPVVPARTFVRVFAGLIALTALTTAVSFVDLGLWSNVVALGIAGLKAALVLLVFMDLRRGPRLLPIAVAAGLLWFLILVGQTLSDYFTRGWLGVPGK